MDRRDLIIEIVNTYGLEVVERDLDLVRQITNYITKSKVHMITTPAFLHNESCQIFTNGETSIFHLNEKIFDFSNWKSENCKKEIISVPNEQLQKYFDFFKSKYKTYISPFTIRYSDNEAVISLINSGRIGRISINEAKLLDLLLEKPKMKLSQVRDELVLYAESEKGYAYIYGKSDGGHQYLLTK